MKVLDIYSKKDFDLLIVEGKSLNDIMNKYFKRFPSTYREVYDRNLADLEIWRVDETPSSDTAYYLPVSNLLLFNDISAVPHELQHMSSYDRDKERLGFVKSFKFPLYEMGLLEGMTEYLAALSMEDAVDDYFFESFAVAMLSSIDGIFEPFYIPNHDKFISLFPNKRDIHSLMYSLNFYHDMVDVVDSLDQSEIFKLRKSIDDTVDSLIDIELSFNKPFIDRRQYADKFMDFISVDDVNDFLSDVHSDYRNYAFNQIKKKVLGRKR